MKFLIPLESRVEEFIVEESGVEKSGVEAWG
jgi:hypothetical protein